MREELSRSANTQKKLALDDRQSKYKYTKKIKDSYCSDELHSSVISLVAHHLFLLLKVV